MTIGLMAPSMANFLIQAAGVWVMSYAVYKHNGWLFALGFFITQIGVNV